MIARVQMGFPFDSALPRDVVTINPHYNTANPQPLLDHLKSALTAYIGTAGHSFTLKAYDARAKPPSYPVATASYEGTIPNSGAPREVALCLSYYAQYNRPTYRGRLYLPVTWFAPQPNVRPSTSVQQAVIDFMPVLAHSLPQGDFWTLWSPRRQLDAQVTDVWCDDEWDTVRSRGLRGTNRLTAKV